MREFREKRVVQNLQGRPYCWLPVPLHPCWIPICLIEMPFNSWSTLSGIRLYLRERDFIAAVTAGIVQLMVAGRPRSPAERSRWPKTPVWQAAALVQVEHFTAWFPSSDQPLNCSINQYDHALRADRDWSAKHHPPSLAQAYCSSR